MNSIGEEGAKALATSIVKVEALREGKRFVVTSGIERKHFQLARQETKYRDTELRTQQQRSKSSPSSTKSQSQKSSLPEPEEPEKPEPEPEPEKSEDETSGSKWEG